MDTVVAAEVLSEVYRKTRKRKEAGRGRDPEQRPGSEEQRSRTETWLFELDFSESF